jgi:hypothetical protein
MTEAIEPGTWDTSGMADIGAPRKDKVKLPNGSATNRGSVPGASISSIVQSTVLEIKSVDFLLALVEHEQRRIIG